MPCIEPAQVEPKSRVSDLEIRKQAFFHPFQATQLLTINVQAGGKLNHPKNYVLEDQRFLAQTDPINLAL